MMIFSHECEPSPAGRDCREFFFLRSEIKTVLFNSNREGRVQNNTQFPFCGKRKA